MSPAKRTKAEAPAAPAKATKAAKPATPKTPKAPATAKAAAPKAVEPKPAKAKAPAKAQPAAASPKPKAPAPRKAPAAVEPVPAAPSAPRPSAAAPKARASAAGMDPVVGAVLAAVQEGRAVEFIFRDADANPPRTFEPRQLTFDTLAQAWFVWGWDRRYNAERHHRVDQLAEVNPVEGVGRAAQGPFPDGTPSNQIGGWRGGEPIPVKAVLMKQWIFAVKQAPAPFPEFTLQDLDEGKAQVSFTGTDLRAIARWCMQFGDGIQVLEPQRLVDRMKQVGVTWGGKPTAAPAPKAEARRDEPKREEHRREEPRREEPRREDHRREEARKSEPRREEARREKHREEKEEPRREEPRKGAKVEVRIERL